MMEFSRLDSLFGSPSPHELSSPPPTVVNQGPSFFHRIVAASAHTVRSLFGRVQHEDVSLKAATVKDALPPPVIIPTPIRQENVVPRPPSVHEKVALPLIPTHVRSVPALEELLYSQAPDDIAPCAPNIDMPSEHLASVPSLSCEVLPPKVGSTDSVHRGVDDKRLEDAVGQQSQALKQSKRAHRKGSWVHLLPTPPLKICQQGLIVHHRRRDCL